MRADRIQPTSARPRHLDEPLPISQGLYLKFYANPPCALKAIEIMSDLLPRWRKKRKL
jgi:hypothetical protein